MGSANLKFLMVTKANKLIESKYSRGLIETRIVDACIAKINSMEKMTPDRYYEISVADLLEATECTNADFVYQQMKNAARNLSKQQLYLPDLIQWINWFGDVRYVEKEGKIALTFTPAIAPYLFGIDGNVTHYTSYMQSQTLQFKGSYSHRIYEFLRQWKGNDSVVTVYKEFSLEELKRRLELDEQYSRIDDLKRRVIDPAVEEINQYSDIFVEYEQRKAGRRVTHFCFSISPNKNNKNKKPKKSKPAAKDKQLIPDFKGHPKDIVDAAKADEVLAAHEALKKKPEAKPKKDINDQDKQRLAGLRKAAKG